MMTVTGLCIVAVVVCISLSISFARQDYDRKGNQEPYKNAFKKIAFSHEKSRLYIGGGYINKLIWNLPAGNY